MRRAAGLLLIAVSLMGAAAIGGCGDPGEFRPAKNAPSYEPVRDAYRLPSRPVECVELGSVYTKGRNALEDLATMSAENGGTHYVVQADQTRIDGYQSPTLGGGSAVSGIVVQRTMWARIYRCPRTGREMASQ